MVAVVRAPAAVPWRAVADQVAVTAGLPAGTVLHRGPAELLGDELVGHPPLMAGAVLATVPALPATAGDGLVLDCIAGPDAGGSIELIAGRPVVVGRSAGCDLVIDDPGVSQRHLRITSTASGVLRIRDLGSTNGTVRLDATEPTTLLMGADESLAIGEPLQLGDSVIRVEFAGTPSLLREPDARGRWQLTLAARVPSTRIDPSAPRHPGSRPLRTSRVTPWLATVVGALAGVVISAVTGMWMFLLMALFGPLTMAATALGDRAGDRRSHSQAVRSWRADELEYRRRCRTVVRADLRTAWREFADPAHRLRWALTGAQDLWRDDPENGHALTMGVGIRPTRVGAPEPGLAPVGSGSEALSLRTGPVPVETILPTRGVVGLCGGERGSLRWLLAQLLTSVPPHRLQLQVHSSREDLWCLDGIPQLRSDTGSVGRVHRQPLPSDTPRNSNNVSSPTRTVLIDDHERWHRDPVVAQILARPEGLVLVTAGSRSRLPRACSAVIDLDELTGTAIGLSRARFRELAEALTPLTVRGTGDDGPPGPFRVPSDHDLDRAWAVDAAPVVALGSAAGSGSAGSGSAGSITVELDLVADGPHLLIAGTTGSGKSELLQTLVGGLIAAAPPERMSLLLIDYKGGSTFAPLVRAPHVAGLVTDLDPALGERVLRSLRAELRRREQHAVDHEPDDPAGRTATIGNRHLQHAPPRLVIVVDEFATLAAELPEFVPGLLDVAQRGRSLGMHLVLATQRPAGVVTPAIRANIGTRICLRVTDPAESVDLIGRPDAATIRAESPGQGFLQRAGRAPERLHVARMSSPGSQVATVGRIGDPVPVASAPSALSLLIDAAVRVAARRGVPLPAPPWRPPPGAVVEHDDPGVLGLLDRPDEQRVEPWPLPAGSLLISGPARSGRSRALLRWSAAVRASGGRLVVIDASGDLGQLVGSDGVSSHLGLDQPDLVLRLFVRLSAEVARRRHQPHRIPPGVIGLVIDGYEAMAAALDTLDPTLWSQQLTDLIARGPSCGIRCAISGDAATDRGRLAAAFGHHVQLGLPDAASTPRPDTAPGRAWVAEIPGAQLQWALPGRWPSHPGSGAADTAGSADAAAPIVVRRLPEVVGLANLAQPAVGSITLGLGGDEGVPVHWDPAGSAGLVVAGTAGAGTSAALRTIVRGGSMTGIPTLWIGRNAPQEPRNIDDRVRVLADPSAAELASILARHEGHLLLVADDAHRFEQDQLGDVLVRFLEHAEPGQSMVLGTRLERLGAFRGAVAELTRSGTGLLLGADSADGAPLGVRLPRRPAGPRNVGRGHFVNGGRCCAIQVAVSDPSDVCSRRSTPP